MLLEDWDWPALYVHLSPFSVSERLELFCVKAYLDLMQASAHLGQVHLLFLRVLYPC